MRVLFEDSVLDTDRRELRPGILNKHCGSSSRHWSWTGLNPGTRRSGPRVVRQYSLGVEPFCSRRQSASRRVSVAGNRMRREQRHGAHGVRPLAPAAEPIGGIARRVGNGNRPPAIERTRSFRAGFDIDLSRPAESRDTAIQKATRLGPYDSATPAAFSALAHGHLLLGDIEPSIAFARTARGRKPAVYIPHMLLAAALALHDELDEEAAALAEGIRVRPRFNSLARLRAYATWGNPHYRALREKTLDLGLLRAGMPVE